jgi:hypothetical protein
MTLTVIVIFRVSTGIESLLISKDKRVVRLDSTHN